VALEGQLVVNELHTLRSSSVCHLLPMFEIFTFFPIVHMSIPVMFHGSGLCIDELLKLLNV
jgi:hypothetical protein